MMPEDRQSKIAICNAPVVEGAVMAATEAWGGGSLADVKRTAEELSPNERLDIRFCRHHP